MGRGGGRGRGRGSSGGLVLLLHTCLMPPPCPSHLAVKGALFWGGVWLWWYPTTWMDGCGRPAGRPGSFRRLTADRKCHDVWSPVLPGACHMTRSQWYRMYMSTACLLQ